ncbi:MAG TPA: caspase family protein, partial [Vicinamibacteria bacterium]|nr:caspase family protein [Vicinamibacteria bacterium]
MKTALLRTVACVAALALPGPALASVERFALVIGANHGGSGRARLKYAVADAERFVQVLHDLGGVDPARAIVLKQPTPARIHEAFEQLRTRLAAAGAASADTRTEALVYYSGHADQAGLLLGDDRISYRSFRESMDGLPADVRIGVIDACASGAITRLKGGRVRPPFMVDAANRMRGHAFLTSSSAHEAAQESDRIASSFFTHYLVSGLRGAADSSGEGTVTLGEAYQFAFRETLGRTAETRAGAQHPAYDLNLSGTGDVVITDLRQTSARLVLSEELGGRCFIRDAEQRLVVEVMKPAGRRIELGLAPGRHEVRCQEKDEARVARPTLEEGRPVVLAAGDFSPGAVDRAQARGQAEDARGLDGRGRLDVTAGMGNDLVPRFGAVGYSRWVSPKLALTFNVGSRGGWTSWNDQ